MYQKEDENEIKKSDGCYTCHNDVSLFIQHDECVGYLESGYFSHVFKKKYGMSPIQCRRQGQ